MIEWIGTSLRVLLAIWVSLRDGSREFHACIVMPTVVCSLAVIEERFQISRSIRQRCPLAPLLYIIVAEAMSIFLRSTAGISRLRLPLRSQVELVDSELVDDTAMFLEAATNSKANRFVPINECPCCQTKLFQCYPEGT